MINYTLPPSPDIAFRDPFAFRSWPFDRFEIETIKEIGEVRLGLQRARVGSGNECSEIRNANISWIPLVQETNFIYERLSQIVRELNGQFFQMDLYGFVEECQYTVYDGSASNPGHYTWHMDSGSYLQCPRKMSLVIQLSDPWEYEGGELQLMTGSNPITLKKEKGLLHAFPSYFLHRVTPVTSGIRRTLVLWVTGPRFK